mgnify:FL=1
MSNFVKPISPVLPAEKLLKRLHSHPQIDSHESAMRCKTGVLDVDLLMEGLVNVDDCLKDCAVVSVTYAARTVNRLTRKKEAVFDARDANGRLIGTYFSCVFKSFAC